MPPKKSQRHTFADTLGEEGVGSREPQPQPQYIHSLAEDKQFTDEHGVTWKRRGGELDANAIAHMINDAALTVLHEYMGRVTEIAAADRQAFWAEAERRMRESRHSDFWGQEFKSEDRRHLVVITEVC